MADFNRCYPVSLFRDGKTFPVKAQSKDFAIIAKRLAIPEVRSLEGNFEVVSVRRDQITTKNHLKAELVRQCVITGDDIVEKIDLDFKVIFVPENDPLLQNGEEDEYFAYEEEMIDLGAALIEQTALEMDTYPRSEGAVLENFVETTPLEDGEIVEKKPNPFEVLKNLKLKKSE